MKFIVDAIPLAILAYPSRRVIDVIERRRLRSTTFQSSSKEDSLRVLPLLAAYIMSTIAATAQRYERTSKLLNPAAKSPKLKRGEKPKEHDEIMA
jgi:hypothetical protein